MDWEQITVSNAGKSRNQHERSLSHGSQSCSRWILTAFRRSSERPLSRLTELKGADERDLSAMDTHSFDLFLVSITDRDLSDLGDLSDFTLCFLLVTEQGGGIDRRSGIARR